MAKTITGKSGKERDNKKLVRVLVPLAIVLFVGSMFVYGFFFNKTNPAQKTPGTTGLITKSGGEKASELNEKAPSAPDAPAPTAPAADTGAPTTEQATATPSDVPPAPAQPEAAGAALGTLRVQEHAATQYSTLGSTVEREKGGLYAMELAFARIGAGVQSLTLANHFEHADLESHETLQRFVPSIINPAVGITPFAAEAVEINGQRLVLSVNPGRADVTFWEETAPGRFQATIVNDAGEPVARIHREYELAQGSYEFTIRQRLENLSGAPLKVRFEQFGPADPPLGPIRYGGDTRRLRFGYMADAKTNPGRVVQSDMLLTHYELLSNPKIGPTGLPYWEAKTLWPTERTVEKDLSLVWAAMTSRYFTVALHEAPGPGGSTAPLVNDGKLLDKVEKVERFVVPNGNPAKIDFVTSIFNFLAGKQRLPAGTAVLKTTSPVLDVTPGSSLDLSFGVYAGPQYKPAIATAPGASAVGLREAVKYTFGGPCGFCTFQTLTHLLLGFLTLLKTYITFDWALAIMLLVVCVRTILHPVTRWSQINIMRFGKQMQRLAPKQKALQEKYASDPTRMRQEMAKLMQEEQINYMGMLGCLPMFLQTPVWIALSAMLFFAFELRHQPAFFGVIQSMTGGNWLFLADLAEPDHLLSFGMPFRLPLLSSFMGPVEGLNLLPLLMGVLFYLQQKYMMPQDMSTMTPEQQQQMKIQRVMMVVLFPVFMYNAPSGLAVYFLTNSVLGILESKWIRAHVDKSELERKPMSTTGVGTRILESATHPHGGTSPAGKKSAPKKGGFMDRVQAAIAEAQKQRDQQMRMKGKGGGGKGRKK